MKSTEFQTVTELNKMITLEEIHRASKKLKNKKAAGIDKIPNKILKCANLFPVVQRLFQNCFDNGIVPQAWRQAIIKPIPKSDKNDKRIPTNHRGISILSTTAKLYTSILNTRLAGYLDHNNGLVESQNEFRKNTYL